jgi:hypothetical protein
MGQRAARGILARISQLDWEDFKNAPMANRRHLILN